MTDKRLELNFWGKLWHHALTLIFICGGGLFTYGYFQQPNNLPPPAVSRTGLLGTSIVFYGMALLVYFYLEAKLKFICLPISINKKEFIERLFEIAKKNKWAIPTDVDLNSTRLEFTKLHVGSTNSDITVDIEKDFIYLNVRGRYPIDKKIIKEIKSILT